jgi:hypothetical protein
MIDLKKSFLFLLNLRVFIIGLIWILFYEVILKVELRKAINLLLPTSVLNAEMLFLTVSINSILPEVIRLFVYPFFVSIILLFALNYWKKKGSDIKTVFQSSKTYYKKILFFYGIFFIIHAINTFYVLVILNRLDMPLLIIPALFTGITYILNFVLLFTPYIIVTTKISFLESLKKSFSLVKANLKYTILVYIITLFVSFLALSPSIIVANLMFYTGQKITLPIWFDIIMNILSTISFIFNISLVMGYYLKIFKS